jgi:hypothetical protein
MSMSRLENERLHDIPSTFLTIATHSSEHQRTFRAVVVHVVHVSIARMSSTGFGLG